MLYEFRCGQNRDKRGCSMCGIWTFFHLDKNCMLFLDLSRNYAEINGINLKKEQINKASEWSLEKGNFSGRTAYQFILTLKKN